MSVATPDPGAPATRLPDLDLPFLRPALDPGVMEPKLRELLGPRDASGLRLVSGRLIAGKRGSRALIEYRAEMPAGGMHLHLLGKHFAVRGQARRFYRAATTLEKLTSPSAFAVPRPLGLLPELGLVVYVPVQGHPLDGMILNGNGEEHVRRAGRALALLHASRIPLDRRFDLRHELLSLQAWATLVAASHPEQADAAFKLADELEAAGPGLRARRDVPIHKDFHYQHVVAGRQLALLDLDEMRLGDPSFDVAHFCAYLELLAVRCGRGPEDAAALTCAFLDEYSHRAAWKADERFAFFGAYACVKIAKQLCTSRGVRPWPIGAELQSQLTFILERGRSFARAMG
jgi:aminoglycoside phosphotransferase (APT) family kinase protein